MPHCVARSQKCTRARSEDILCHRMHSSTRHNTPNAGKNTVSTSAMFKHCNAEPRVEDCLFLLSLQHTTWPSKPQPCHVLLPCLLCPCQWAEHWFWMIEQKFKRTAMFLWTYIEKTLQKKICSTCWLQTLRNSMKELMLSNKKKSWQVFSCSQHFFYSLDFRRVSSRRQKC